MNFAKEIANRVLFVCGQSILEEGTPNEIFDHLKHPRLQEFLSKM